MATKWLRILTRAGWSTKPLAGTPANALTATEIDQTLLQIHDDKVDKVNPTSSGAMTHSGSAQIYSAVINASCRIGVQLELMRGNVHDWSFNADINPGYLSVTNEGSGYPFKISKSGSRFIFGGGNDDGLSRVQIEGDFSIDGNVVATYDNTRTIGTAPRRWSTIYAASGSINTSDAREKTDVRAMSQAEIEASKQISKEIGIYQWLSAIKEKGDSARLHVGLTVQRAIEIMESNGLDPFAYGFICYDKWDDAFVEHPAVEYKPADIAEDGTVISQEVKAQAARIEQTQVAGDRYAFRYDELNLFIARGLDARLSALEDAA